MYESYYHLKARPFQLSPDPAFLFSSWGHRRAMAYLTYGLHQGEGFIVITGDVGAGKTMLASTLARMISARAMVLAQVVSTNLEADDFVRMVAAAFGLPQDGSKAVLLNRIEQFLVSRLKQGKRALLIVDEAQNLPPRSLEELRMLSNFVSGGKSLLQTFLLGQPEFRSTLQSTELDQLRQRVIATCHLGPMNEAETQSYVVHRLTVAGWRDDPSFSSDAFAGIYLHTGGIPRRINVLCDRLLLLGHLDEKHILSGREVAEVVNDLQQEFAPAAVRAGREGEG
jgi:putative secretion ATPase (PEP-CTERM system associated)